MAAEEVAAAVPTTGEFDIALHAGHPTQWLADNSRTMGSDCAVRLVSIQAGDDFADTWSNAQCTTIEGPAGPVTLRVAPPAAIAKELRMLEELLEVSVVPPEIYEGLANLTAIADHLPAPLRGDLGALMAAARGAATPDIAAPPATSSATTPGRVID